MDPNETLRQLREMVTEILDEGSEDDSTEREDEFAQLFQALDEWVSKGGFLPRNWVK